MGAGGYGAASQTLHNIPRVARKRGNGWYQCLEGARSQRSLSKKGCFFFAKMTCISFEKNSVDKTVMVMHTVRLDKCNNVSFLRSVRNAARSGFVEASLAASRGSALSLQGTSVAPGWPCGGFLGRFPSLASHVSALGKKATGGRSSPIKPYHDL